MALGGRMLLVVRFAGALGASVLAQVPEKDYLTNIEAEKIRDAETTNERIKLFIMFADDRIKKFQYELEHPSQNNHEQQLNYLMNSYTGCVDDAEDLVQLVIEKQQNVRAGLDVMPERAKKDRESLNTVKEDAETIRGVMIKRDMCHYS